MFKGQDFLKGKLSTVSAKALSLGGKQFIRNHNEYKASNEQKEAFLTAQLWDQTTLPTAAAAYTSVFIGPC